MKNSIFIISLMIGGAAWAGGLVSDDFNRGDTAYSDDASLSVGTNWVLVGHTNARVAIKSNELNFDVNPTLSAHFLTYNTGVAMNAGTSADENRWTMAGELTLHNHGMWAGVAFNIQDADNYYVLRTRWSTHTYQLFYIVNGELQNNYVFLNNSDMAGFSGDTLVYTVSCSAAGEFTFTITEPGSSTVLNPTTNATATSVVYDGGGGGFYHYTGLASQGPDALYDNFNLQADPLPSSTYGGWVAKYPTLGSKTNYLDDPDSDAMNNLLEYALGGIPTNSDAAGVLPSFGMYEDGGLNWMSYIYKRRLDATARKLTYAVVSDGDLLAGALTNATEEVGASAIDADFETVTNRISVDTETQMFMTLKVEINE